MSSFSRRTAASAPWQRRFKSPRDLRHRPFKQRPSIQFHVAFQEAAGRVAEGAARAAGAAAEEV